MVHISMSHITQMNHDTHTDDEVENISKDSTKATSKETGIMISSGASNCFIFCGEVPFLVCV